MKKLLISLLLISLNNYSQNFEKVDSLVLTYPRFSKVELLANRIEKDFKTDSNKARAAFFWLTKNIRYNLKEYYNPNQRYYRFSYSTIEEKEKKLQILKDNLIKKAFITKKGVCEEYAQSFKKICDLLGIEAQVIKGYVKNNVNEIENVPFTTNHAWNAVKINGKWIILDATWAAGYELNRRWVREFNNYFFNMPKDKILKTHYPEDSIWVLRFGRMTLREFYEQPIYNNSFLNSDIKLILPILGTIQLKSLNHIEFKFENLKTPVYYAFKENKYLKKASGIRKNKITSIRINNPKRSTVLYLFINNKNALKFKLMY